MAKVIFSAPIVIEGCVQSYEWGMGEDSVVHRFSGKHTENGKYAELWFGAHPNGQATVVGTGVESTLLEMVSEYPQELLGPEIVAQYGEQFPFLFKFLSVGSALSIQAHPDEERPGVENEYSAEKLHAQDPEHYKDANPKPEVGIAQSDVELLYGFRPVSEIAEFIQPGEQEVPELVAAMGELLAAEVVAGEYSDSIALEKMYKAVMKLSEEGVTRLCQQMYERLQATSAADRSAEDDWVLDLQETYPKGDVGLFCMYLLNLVTVSAGKALYIGPDIPHAYLKNELAECMAPSDNVVRAGLTPKFIDIDTLLGMLNYSPQPPELLDPVSTGKEGYAEFPVSLDKWFKIGVVSEGTLNLSFDNNDRLELLIVTGETTVTAGNVTQQLSPGKAALIPAMADGYEVSVENGQLFRVQVP